MNEKSGDSWSGGRIISVLLAVIAALTLVAGLFAWVYSELRPLASLEQSEITRKEWLGKWDEERSARHKLSEDRIERLENMHMTGNHTHD